MNREIFYVLAFNSTHHAIKAEKLLKESNIDVKTIPTPREVTASCGLSLKFDRRVLKEVVEGIKNEELAIKGIYEITKDKNGRSCIKLQ